MNKQTTVRAVAQRTGHTYFEVQTILEAIIEAWTEELLAGRQIALQDFLTIKLTKLKPHRRGNLRNHTSNTPIRKTAYRVDTRLSQTFRERLGRVTK